MGSGRAAAGGLVGVGAEVAGEAGSGADSVGTGWAGSLTLVHDTTDRAKAIPTDKPLTGKLRRQLNPDRSRLLDTAQR